MMAATTCYSLVLVWLGSLAFVLGASTTNSTEFARHIDIESTEQVLKNTEFSVTCLKCSVVGDFSISGGDGSTPDSNFSSLPFDYSETWVGAVLEDFAITVDVNIDLTPTGPTNEISIPLLGPNGLEIPLKYGIFDITWAFNPTIHGWVNSSAPANFSYGFQFVIPPNSAVWVPIFHLDNISTVGFSQSTLTPLAYNSSDANDDFAFELSFRPILSVTGSVLEVGDVEAAVFADVPKLDVVVSQVSNATRDCNPAAASTPADQVFHNLTLVTPSLGVDLGFNATDLGLHLANVSGPVALATSCLDYLPGQKALGTPPASSSRAYRPPLVNGGLWVTSVLVLLLLLA